MNDFTVALEALVVAAVLVGASVVYARRAGVYDIPNHRSSHRSPTPTGAGIGFVISVLLMGLLVTAREWPRYSGVFGLVALSLAALAFVGWLDDRSSLSPGMRLTVHILVSIAVIILVNRFAPLSGYANFAWLLLWGFWTVASINIVNFMDGIDGMVGAQGLVYGLYLFAALPRHSLVSLLALILASVSLGFLIWNWAPAKIFLGDVGSGPLGMMLVILGALAVGVGMHPALVFLPLFPLFFDSLATFILRLGRGERVTVAHRSHLYQRLVGRSAGHGVVSASYAAAAAVGGAVAATLQGASTQTMVLGILGYIILTVTAWMYLHRRFPVADAPGDYLIRA